MGNQKKVLAEFASDYYRMTGTQISLFKAIKNCIFMHNIRYMYWWRKRRSNPKNILAKWKCYRYSRKYGLEIGNCQIGPGLYLGHPYNITVGSEAVIGSNVNLSKGVTIGQVNSGERKGSPTIGDCVWIGVNATVVGGIHVGNDVVIAPNSFVNFDVPDHAVVVGNPGAIHRKDNAAIGYISFKV